MKITHAATVITTVHQNDAKRVLGQLEQALETLGDTYTRTLWLEPDYECGGEAMDVCGFISLKQLDFLREYAREYVL